MRIYLLHSLDIASEYNGLYLLLTWCNAHIQCSQM